MLNYVALFLLAVPARPRRVPAPPGQHRPDQPAVADDSAALPAAARAALPAAPRASCSRSPRRSASGGCSTAPRSGSGSAPSAPTRTPRAPRAWPSSAATSCVDARSPAGSPGWPAPRRCSAPSRRCTGGDRRRHRLRRHHRRPARAGPTRSASSLAGLLFGALRAGASPCSPRTGAPIDIVLVLQVARSSCSSPRPPLVRAVFRLQPPARRERPLRARWRHEHPASAAAPHAARRRPSARGRAPVSGAARSSLGGRCSSRSSSSGCWLRPGTTTFRSSRRAATSIAAARSALPSRRHGPRAARRSRCVARWRLCQLVRRCRAAARSPPGSPIAVRRCCFVARLPRVGHGRRRRRRCTLVSLLQRTLLLAIPLIFGALAGRARASAPASSTSPSRASCSPARSWRRVVGEPGRAARAPGWSRRRVAGAARRRSLLALFAIRYLVDQVIVGVVLNVLVLGLTSFLSTTGAHATNAPTSATPRGVLPPLPIPLLGDIPVARPAAVRASRSSSTSCTSSSPCCRSCCSAPAGACACARWGSTPRPPTPSASTSTAPAASTCSLGGAVAGLGGAYFTLGTVGRLHQEHDRRQGFIALAAMIFGRWSPLGALAPPCCSASPTAADPARHPRHADPQRSSC